MGSWGEESVVEGDSRSSARTSASRGERLTWDRGKATERRRSPADSVCWEEASQARGSRCVFCVGCSAVLKAKSMRALSWEAVQRRSRASKAASETVDWWAGSVL